jgi:hypothetical protein
MYLEMIIEERSDNKQQKSPCLDKKPPSAKMLSGNFFSFFSHVFLPHGPQVYQASASRSPFHSSPGKERFNINCLITIVCCQRTGMGADTAPRTVILQNNWL